MAKKVKKTTRHAGGHKEKRYPLSNKVDSSNKKLVVEKEKLVLKEQKCCKHADKGIDLEKFSARTRNHRNVHCHDCRIASERREKKGSRNKQAQEKGNIQENGSFNCSYICLVCGHLGCGQSDDPSSNVSHAFKHWQTTRHPYAVRTDNPVSCWCFECGVYITGSVKAVAEGAGDSNEALLEALKFIKEHLSSDSRVDAQQIWSNCNSQEAHGQPEARENSTSDVKDGEFGNSYVVKGLVNLGNTCFFNSVMQNLLALETLRDHFRNAIMSNTGPISLAMKKLYKETSVIDKDLRESNHGSRNSGSINPKNLFNSICSKAPQFRGYQQHDSHELLRCLLDGLNSEEMVIQESSVDSEEEDEEKKASLSNGTFVNGIFGGKLSSTVCCLECGHSSVVYEPFLDLSLPVPTRRCSSKKEPVVPPTKRTSSVAVTSNRGRKSRGRAAAVAVPRSPDVATDLVATSLLSSELSSSSVPSSTPILVETTVQDEEFSWMDYLGPTILSDESSCHLSSAVSEYYAESYGFSATSVSNEDGVTHVNEPSQNSENGSVLEHEGQSSQPNITDEIILGVKTILPCQSQPQKPCTDKLAEESTGNGCFPRKELIGYESSGENEVVDELPLSVQDSEVLLFPHKEVDLHPIDPNNSGGQACDDVPLEETKIETLSVIGYEEKSDDFDGFGDLFNEPESVESGLASESLQEMETNLLAGNSSESNQEEVDDTNSPVSVDVCLGDFFKPELLSGEHAWNCGNCSKIVNCQSHSCGQDSSSGATLTKPQEDADGFRSKKSDADVDQRSVGTSENGVLDSSGVLVDSLSIAEIHSTYAGLPADVVESNKSLLETCGMEQLLDTCQKVDRVIKHKHRVSSRIPKLKRQKGIMMSCNTAVMKRDATKRFLINRAPPVLTIHLKRFSQDARGRLSKLSGHINFQTTLNLKPYMDARCTDKSSCIYHLVGVVEHSGTMRGGHYVAYVRGQEKRGSSMDAEDGQSVGTWYYVSDHHVREVALKEVLQSEAYILFYERSEG